MLDNNWVYIGLFFLVAPMIPLVAIVLPSFLAPKKPNPLKSTVYECGIEPIGGAQVQFKAQYYIYALAFLIFDIETVFLYPWAVAFDRLPMFAVIEGVIFILILLAGLIYAWRKGALEWS